ncbi:hypothetical protein MD588_13355 [Photobacterium sp. SDRW27]|uniref:hypothetical protein n=1 Tax=Photobacterium obscurum TaxID=2829490 RepID=UPI002244A412|nr:hypothetical protein [Photobacterium obscurum]MCW8329795.1 hypothetical protein [Photobacterium obscurum]
MNNAGFAHQTLLLLAKQLKLLQATQAILEGQKVAFAHKQQALCSLHDSIEQNINTMINKLPVTQHSNAAISAHGTQQTENESGEFINLIKHNWKVKLAQTQLDARISRVHRQDKRIREAIDKAQALLASLAKKRGTGAFSSSLQVTLELSVLRNQLLLKQYNRL